MMGSMRRLRRASRRLPPSLLLFAPSVLLGVLGALWLLLRPLDLPTAAPPGVVLLVAAALTVALLTGAWLLESTLPSFRHAGRLLERALLGLRLTLPLSVALALATAVSEELFFRGALLGLVGVWPQALLFGLLHPATRRGWSYTLFTFVAGLAFGYATLWTGSLWAAMLAHFVINLQGFLELRKRQRQRPPDRFTPPIAAASGSRPATPAEVGAAAPEAGSPASSREVAPAIPGSDREGGADRAASPGISESAPPPPREPPVS